MILKVKPVAGAANKFNLLPWERVVQEKSWDASKVIADTRLLCHIPENAMDVQHARLCLINHQGHVHGITLLIFTDEEKLVYRTRPSSVARGSLCLWWSFFLLVYKILAWITLHLGVWTNHIWSLMVCHEWLWGIRANAVAWDHSYNNTDSFEGPIRTAKTRHCLPHPVSYRGSVLFLLTDLSGLQPRAGETLWHEFFLWHHLKSPLARSVNPSASQPLFA